MINLMVLIKITKIILVVGGNGIRDMIKPRKDKRGEEVEQKRMRYIYLDVDLNSSFYWSDFQFIASKLLIVLFSHKSLHLQGILPLH